MLHRLNPLQIPSYLSIALLCCIASFLTPHGTITIDEGAYYLATKAFTDSGSLSLQNGLTKSIGFEIIGAKPIVEYVGEHLYSQYPPGHAILSSPLYALFGLSGLFLVNGIATALILILTFLIAQNIYSSKREGYIASALALVACPSLLYASSVWPHALSSSLILLTYFILFHRQNNPFSPLVSGLVAGVALLIRLDSAIPLFALDISLLLATPLRINLKRLSLFTLGSLPALLALCILNSYKYGFFSPLVYGVDGHGSLLRSLPFLVVTITALTILLFFFHWLSRREITLSDKASLLGVLAALLLAILTTPESLKKLYSILFHFHQGDARFLENFPLQILGGSSRGIFATHKLAFFQCSPVLALSFFAYRCKNIKTHLTPLVLVPLSLALFFGLQGWHGGLSLSMRYLSPALPFLCILSAGVITHCFSSYTFNLKKILYILLLSIFFVLSFAYTKLFLLDFSTLLTLTLLLSLSTSRAPAHILLTLSLSASIAINSWQLINLLTARKRSRIMVEALQEYTTPGALLLVDASDALFPLLEDRPLHLYSLLSSSFQETQNVLQKYCAARRRVYAIHWVPYRSESYLTLLENMNVKYKNIYESRGKPLKISEVSYCRHNSADE